MSTEGPGLKRITPRTVGVPTYAQYALTRRNRWPDRVVCVIVHVGNRARLRDRSMDGGGHYGALPWTVCILSFLYAVMRIVVGFLFACHGAQKLFGVLGGVGPEGGTAPLFSLMGLAGIIEFFGGLCIMLGLLTGYVAFIASGEMAAAYFMAHYPGGFWPIQNTGELAALYCFVFLYMASVGPGMWSLDRALGKP